MNKQREKFELFLKGRPSERDIASYIGNDLTLMASALANPSDEYIIFKEFQLTPSDQIDFVIFTSRSKLSVIFVEIKGAEFDFLLKDGTAHSTIKKAIDQVAERFEYPRKDYRRFHSEVHSLKQRVEKGEQIHQSIKNGYLDVSAEKEVVYSGVAIGGTELDDIKESCVRDRLTHYGKHYITCHSWQSFCRTML